MAGSKFETFKAGDVQKPKGQGGGRAGKGQENKTETVSAGFPTIEGLIEQEHLDLSGLSARVSALKTLSETGSAVDKGAARKALAAYERTEDLMNFLWETKTGLGES